MEGYGVDEFLSLGGVMIQQVIKQEILDFVEVSVFSLDAVFVLDVLLCVVIELGGVEGRVGFEEKVRFGYKDVLVQLFSQEVFYVVVLFEVFEIYMFQDIQESFIVMEFVEVLIQVVRFSVVIVSQERVQVVFKKVVQGVFQFVVCDSVVVGQFMKEGVIQVIVNEEGIVYMLVREGFQIIMQEVEVYGQYVDLVESDGEILQIIVIEELVQVMVQEFSSNFFEGAIYYIVIELFSGV